VTKVIECVDKKAIAFYASAMESKNGRPGPAFWWKTKKTDAQAQTCALVPKPGHLCPVCQQGRLDYDGLFVLTCAACGYVAAAGAFT
jgi:ribosomal protein L37AE/L43A